MVRAMKVNVIVMPKPAVLDPQGVAAAEAMRHLGFNDAKSVRVGRCIEIETDGHDEEKLREICSELLSNPVIEDYRIEVSGEH